MNRFVLAISVFWFSLTVQCSTDDALSIAKEVDSRGRGYGGSISVVEMTNLAANGQATTYTIEVKVKEYPDGNKSVMRFLQPAEDSGTALIVHSRDGDDDQWVFLPKNKRLKKISGSLKNSSFLGGEFTFFDLSDVQVADYNYKLLADADDGGVDCYVLERTPVENDVNYSRIVVYINKTIMAPIKVEYFFGGALIKSTLLSDYQKNSDGRWRANFVLMKNATTGKSTSFRTLNSVITSDIPDSDFSVSSFR